MGSIEEGDKAVKRRGMAALLAALVALSLTGCGSEAGKVFTAAERDLNNSSYTYALSGYQTCLEAGHEMALSYRGVGICCLRLGRYQEAVDAFTNALGMEKVGKGLQKDLLSYRITARIPLGQLREAQEDCRRLLALGDLDADGYFLTGRVALALDSYEEARQSFESSYLSDTDYDRAIQIYEVYVEKGMEADGTYFLELSLNKAPKSAQEYCDCGRIYYYMGDYDNARNQLIEAQKKGSKESILLLGMVYMGKGDYSNARAMYTQYVTQVEASGRGYNGLALCDIAQGNYASARQVIAEGVTHATTEEMMALLFNEVVTYEMEYDFATARQKAEEYMEMFPQDQEMARELTFLRSRTG